MLRAFGGRAAAAPVVLPLAMMAFRLSISRHGPDSRDRLRLHGTCHCLGARTRRVECPFST